MTIDTLEALFLHRLKDVLYAERKMHRSLPGMERKATAARLKAAFAAHSAETEEHLARLEEAFDVLDLPARGTRCEAMVGLVDEAERLTADISDAATMDAALIALAQAMKHYLIARYGTLVAWAMQLGHSKLAAQLKATLDDKYAFDRALSRLAEVHLNPAAAAAA